MEDTLKKKEEVREYRFPDAELIQKSDDILNSAIRDSQEFDKVGYTSAKRSAFRLLRNTFADLPADCSFEGSKISATQNRNHISSQLELKLRIIYTIFENKWGKNDGRYKELGNRSISRLNDEQLFRTARGVKATSLKYLNDLKDDGLTDSLISELDNLIQLYDDSIDSQREAVRLRDINTEERVAAGNRLYKELVKICSFGKVIWYSVNEAKYNDYIIYNTTSGKSEEEETPMPA